MRFYSVMNVIKCSKMYNRPVFNYIKCTLPNYCRTMSKVNANEKSFSLSSRLRNEEDDEDLRSNTELYDRFSFLSQMYSRDLLQKNTKDILTRKISYCASLNDLFKFIESNKHKFRSEHFVQTVLVLCDLKKIYNDLHHITSRSSCEFFYQLQNNENFEALLHLIENRLDNFESQPLSYVLLYLNLLGLKMDSVIMQKCARKLEQLFIANFSLAAASRYLQAVFSEKSLKSFYRSQSIIPGVFKEIDTCNSIESLHNLSICLNNLHDVVPMEYLEKYKRKVQKFIDDKRIDPDRDYKTILQVILLLNYPQWRPNCVHMIANLILLLQNRVNLLSMPELVVVYEIFCNLQEPGEMLNELQRCSAKYLQELDFLTREKIVLTSSVLFFSPHNLRRDIRTRLKSLVKSCDDLENLYILGRMISFVKTTDQELCELYWTKVAKLMQNESDSRIVGLGQSYLNFNFDMDYGRSITFEKEILGILEKASHDTLAVFPRQLVLILCFALIYSDRSAFLEYLIEKIEQNHCQLGPMDCLRLALTLKALNNTQNKYLKLPFLRRLTIAIDKAVERHVKLPCSVITHNDALIKACVALPNTNIKLIDELFANYKNRKQEFNSKTIENITYCLLATSTVIPDLLETITEYVVAHPHHGLGFNISKILHAFFMLGYTPKDEARFFQTATNIIIRDQERMSGLSLLQSALSLCHFNFLPNSLIKSVFNAEFLDKLDQELENCYSKDRYPQRVRNTLMQLNRAVCIDCPEARVPWFHEKYMRENLKMGSVSYKSFHNKVKDTLRILVRDKEAVVENFITPYGYTINFLLQLDPSSSLAGYTDSSKGFAILLIPQQAFTRLHVQLRGKYLLKKRHLEILGYKVIMVNFSDWISLFYPQDRLYFLSNLIWPQRPIEKLLR